MSSSRPEEPKIHKGLAGVVVDTTAISKVVPETNSLTYRGYPVQDLAAHCSFEQVAYLIWHGELPNAGELEQFTQRERAASAGSTGRCSRCWRSCPTTATRWTCCALRSATSAPRIQTRTTARDRRTTRSRCG